VIGLFTRAFDSLLGRGDAAVTVPPLDGALRPNRKLDEASWRLPLAEVDALAVVSGRLVASAGHAIHDLVEGPAWRPRRAFEAEITAIAPLGINGLAVALTTGEIHMEGGAFAGRRYRAAEGVRCITALAAAGTDLYVANGSASHGPGDWQSDLMEHQATGSLWRIDLNDGRGTLLADRLAYPAGLVVDDASLVFAEAWRHRLVRIGRSAAGPPEVVCADLPGYPGRIWPVADGWWLAVFAPRSQLVEFVLREHAYRRRMMAEVPRPFWIAPTLRSGRSFYEPLQGGAVKQLGQLKPWAPTLSAGLCVRLDHAFQPSASLHSRADGATHGVTAVVDDGTQVFAAARGDGVVVAIPLGDLAAGER